MTMKTMKNRFPARSLLLVAGTAALMMGCNGSSSSDTTMVSDTTAFSAPPSDCLWVGPYVKENEGFNFAYPDSGAIYWSAAYTLPEDGAYITLEADFPYSRYMSFNSYRANTTPAQSLTDKNIIAEAGSINPFIDGAVRTDPSRRYLVTVKPGDPNDPANPSEDNTLYDATSAAGEEAVLIYRNYVPNIGADRTGDVGLPRVTLHLADGSTLQGEEACAAMSAGTDPLGIPFVPADTYETLRANFEPARETPAFRASYGTAFLFQCDFQGNCKNNPPRNTAFYANADNQYLYSFLNQDFGDVVVIRGKIPEIPETLNDQEFFNENDLRYWSLCQNEYYSQAVKECLYDEQIFINPDGFYTIVTSEPENRPENADSDCGVGYLPWPNKGDGFSIVDGKTDDPDSAFLIVRNMLPADDFNQAIQNTMTAGDEASVLGDFMPKATYMSKAEFEDLGCAPYTSLAYDQL